jgi:hexokinase
MALPTAVSGLSRVSSTRLFDDIESQFQLGDDGLYTITKQFLEDFRLGLGEYNHAMAMMYA